MIIQMPDGLAFQRTSAERILRLRHDVLRQGLPIECAHFEGDRANGTCHYAAFPTTKTDGPDPEPVCCASFMLNNEWKGMPAYQLRGMATAFTYQHKGIGKLFLPWCEDAIVLGTPIRVLWCNARMSAVGFYEKQGWNVASAPFMIPEAGMHRKMTKALLDHPAAQTGTP